MPLWKRNLYVCWFGTLITCMGGSMVLPFLPLYVEELGVHSVANIEQWSGAIYGITFLLSAVVSPIWGKLADRRGRKLMLLRASLGIAVTMSLMGFAQNVYQLLALRFIMGAVSGYVTAGITLVAAQAPREHAGWALGLLSTGAVAGNLMGPLAGGGLAELLGLRNVFFTTGLVVFVSFLVSWFFIKEEFIPKDQPILSGREVRSMISNPRVVWAMFISTFVLQMAYFSIEPIVTVYVKLLSEKTSHVALMAGAVVSASGVASILAAPWLGKLSDSIGPRKVLLAGLMFASLVFIPQAFVKTPYQLMGLRFLMGLASAGLLPAINTLIKRSTPAPISGRVFGYAQSAHYMGSLIGPILGGQVAAYFGIKYNFFLTSAFMMLNAAWVYKTRPAEQARSKARC